MNNFFSKFIKKFKINEKSVNFILILILGFLVGVAVKTEAKKRVTIGYNDYLVTEMKQGFDLLKEEPPVPAQAPGTPVPSESNK
jgi:hypothetical protein